MPLISEPNYFDDVAVKLPVINSGNGSIVPIHVKPDRSSFEFR